MPGDSHMHDGQNVPRARFYRRIGKRAFDLALAVPLAIVLLPLFGGIALAVRLRLGSPVLFRQQRPGKDGRLFVLSKFRTMTSTRDEQGQLLPDDRRLTRLGRFLRSTSLDELPEIWNVIRGEMSLVGPRPLLPQYLDRYSTEQNRRHEVLPGITGWAQVNGRNAVDWDRRLQLDVWYVDHSSLLLDLRILLQTVRQVALRSGISAPGHATSPEFQGSPGPLQIAGHRLDPQGVIVLGAGGHARVVIAALQESGDEVTAVFDDDPALAGTEILGVPVVGPVSLTANLTEVRAVIAIGSNTVRQELARRFPLNWTTIVHPRAWVHSSVSPGRGSVVFAGAIVQPGAHIGDHVIINTAATVDHDCRIGDFAHLAPGTHLAGDVTVEHGAFLGTASAAIPSVRIGAGTTVGAGAVVVRDLPAGITAVGCPARILSGRHPAERAA